MCIFCLFCGFGRCRHKVIAVLILFNILLTHHLITFLTLSSSIEEALTLNQWRNPLVLVIIVASLIPTAMDETIVLVLSDNWPTLRKSWRHGSLLKAIIRYKIKLFLTFNPCQSRQKHIRFLLIIRRHFNNLPLQRSLWLALWQRSHLRNLLHLLAIIFGDASLLLTIFRGGSIDRRFGWIGVYSPFEAAH